MNNSNRDVFRHANTLFDKNKSPKKTHDIRRQDIRYRFDSISSVQSSDINSTETAFRRNAPVEMIDLDDQQNHDEIVMDDSQTLTNDSRLKSYFEKNRNLSNHQNFYHKQFQDQKLGALNKSKDKDYQKSAPNNTSKQNIQKNLFDESKIDFKKLDKEIKEKVEAKIPFSKQSIEDVIFIDNETLLAIECIYYQQNTNSKYHTLSENNPEIGTIEDLSIQETRSNLFKSGSNLVQKMPSLYGRKKSQKSFQAVNEDDDQNYGDALEYFVERQDNLENCSGTQCNKAKVQLLLSKWKINKQGQLFRMEESQIKDHQHLEINEPSRQYMEGRLNLSQDKKLFYRYWEIDHQEQHNSKNPFKLHLSLFNTEDMGKIELNERLKQLLLDLPRGILKDVQIVNHHQTLFISMRLKDSATNVRYLRFFLFDIVKGKKILDVQNYHKGDKLQNKSEIIGILFNQKQRKDKKNRLPPLESLSLASSKGQSVFVKPSSKLTIPLKGVSSASPLKNPKIWLTTKTLGNNSDNESDIKQKTFDFEVTFVISMMKTSSNMKSESYDSENSEQFKSQNIDSSSEFFGQKEELEWTTMKIKITDIQKYENQDDLNQFIYKKSQDQFEILRTKENKHQFKKLPYEWSFGKSFGEEKEKANHSQINVSANQDLTEIAFINEIQKMYFAFDMVINSQGLPSLQTADSSNFPDIIDSQILPRRGASVVTHGRNQWSKPQMYLTIVLKSESTTTYCFNKGKEKSMIKFSEDNILAYQDAIIQTSVGKGCYEKTVFQSIVLSAGDREIILKTQNQHVGDNTYTKMYKRSVTQRIETHYPMIAYNIGASKLIFQDSLGDSHQFIFDLKPGEQFINFCQWNTYDDFGFESKLSKYYKSRSVFAYLTWDREKDYITINLMFVDIFVDKPKFTLHRSIKKFFHKHDSINNDIFVCSILYNSRCQHQSKNVKPEIKLLNQFRNHFTMQKLMTEKNIKHAQQVEQSPYLGVTQQKSLGGQRSNTKTSSKTDQYEDNEPDEGDHEVCIPLQMILDEKGFIYYLVQEKGHTKIKEINPFYDHIHQHTTIFEIKSDWCYGFQKDKDQFYFMDDTKSLIRLVRQEESRMLREDSQYVLKDKDRPNIFKNTKSTFDMILNSQFIIQKARIFYINHSHRNPYRAGILDMEDLVIEYKQEMKNDVQDDDLEVKYIQGPIEMEESNEFMIIYNIKDSREYKLKIYKKPNTKQQVILRDIFKQVEFSTFLDDGSILLLQIDKFLLFDSFAEYVNELGFYGKNKEPYEDLNEIFDDSQSEDSQKNNQRSIQKDNQSKQFRQHLRIDKNLRDSFVLKAISENHRYFLFFKEDKRSNINQQYQKFYVFELCNSGEKGSIDKTWDCKMFREVYSYDLSSIEFINFFKDIKQVHMSELELNRFVKQNEYLKKLYTFSTDIQIQDILSTDNQVKDKLAFKYELDIKNKGQVHFIHSSWTQLEKSNIVVKAFFINSDVNHYKLEEEYKFPPSSRSQIDDLLEKQIGKLYHKIKAEAFNQEKLPQSLQNFSKLEALNGKYERLLEREAGVTKVKLFSNVSRKLLIVKCGNEFKLTYINEVNEELKPFYQCDKGHELKVQTKINYYSGFATCKECGEDIEQGDLHYHCVCKQDYHEKCIQSQKSLKNEVSENVYNELNPSVEIVDILNTCVPNQLQIIAKDNDKNVLFIQTWDFKKNCEVSILQIKIQPETYPEYHILRGINHKRNYFADKYHVYDLENNVPIQRYDNSMSVNLWKKKRYNLRKIFHQNDRQLSSENNNILNYPYSRRDLLLWQNIVTNFGDNTKIIDENTDICNYLTIYKDISMFHYFTNNPKVLKVIYNKYKSKFMIGQLTEEEQTLPLLIFHRDQNGKTAIDYARKEQNYKSFKIFIDLITFNSSDYLYTRLMLENIPFMLMNQSETNLNFFDKCIYQPPIIQDNIIIDWPEDAEDYVFCSNTSIITKNLVEKELQKKNLVRSNQDDIESSISLDESNSQWKNNSKNIFVSNGITPLVLGDQDESLINQERIMISIIDFDWLFETNEMGKTGHNTAQLVNILAHLESTDIFAKKPIQIIIKLFWQELQPQIIRKVFFPYLAFTALFLDLNQYVDTTFDDYTMSYGVLRNPQEIFMIKLFLLFVFQVYFLSLSYRQLKKDPIHFYRSFESYTSIFIYGVNFDILAIMCYDFHCGQKILTNPYARAYYAFRCFIIWMKIYYMMRIFSNYGQFITVIGEVVKDIRVFSVMLIIIMLAFSNFFYVIDDDEGYIDRNWKTVGNNNSLINSIITTYLISLGEFSISGFSRGVEQPIMWIFFVLASFVILIVFMNLLITIIANKYDEVMITQEQSVIHQQADMLIQYQCLMDDENNIFLNQKYVIYLSKYSDLNQNSNSIKQLFENFKQQLFQKNDHLSKNQQRKDEQNEINSRLMMKQMVSQQEEMAKIKHLMNDCIQMNVRALQQQKVTQEEIQKLITNKGQEQGKTGSIVLLDEDKNDIDIKKVDPSRAGNFASK